MACSAAWPAPAYRLQPLFRRPTQLVCMMCTCCRTTTQLSGWAAIRLHHQTAASEARHRGLRACCMILPACLQQDWSSNQQLTSKPAPAAEIRGVPVAEPLPPSDFSLYIEPLEAILSATNLWQCCAANILVRYLGEEGPATPLAAAVSMCNPFNLVSRRCTLCRCAGCKSRCPGVHAERVWHGSHPVHFVPKRASVRSQAYPALRVCCCSGLPWTGPFACTRAVTSYACADHLQRQLPDRLQPGVQCSLGAQPPPHLQHVSLLPRPLLSPEIVYPGLEPGAGVHDQHAVRSTWGGSCRARL